MICTSRKAGSFFRRRIMSSARRAWPFAVSTTSASTPASIRAEARCQASPRKPTPAATRRRPWPSLVASGYCSVLTKSLTVIRPASLPFSSISGSFSHLVLGEQAVGVLLGDVRRAGDQVLTGHDVLDPEMVVIVGRDETHVAVGDDADEAVLLVHNRQAGDVETATQLVQIGQGDVRVHGQRVGDHAGFGTLDHIHLSGLIVRSTGCGAARRCRRCGPWRWPSRPR